MSTMVGHFLLNRIYFNALASIRPAPDKAGLHVDKLSVISAGGLLISVLIFSLQIPLSVWWLRRFQYGPLEWLWRGLTYGKRPPFLKKKFQRLQIQPS